MNTAIALPKSHVTNQSERKFTCFVLGRWKVDGSGRSWFYGTPQNGKYQIEISLMPYPFLSRMVAIGRLGHETE